MDHFKQEVRLSFAIIGGSIIAFGAMLYFLSQDFLSQADSVAADRLIITERAAAIGVLAGLKTDAPKAAPYLEAMNKILPPQDQLLDFRRWIDELARTRKVGMSFAFQGTQTPSHGDSPGFISFSLDITGLPSNLVDFMKDLEYKSPHFLVALDNLDFSKSVPNYRILINARVFFK